MQIKEKLRNVGSFLDQAMYQWTIKWKYKIMKIEMKLLLDQGNVTRNRWNFTPSKL